MFLASFDNGFAGEFFPLLAAAVECNMFEFNHVIGVDSAWRKVLCVKFFDCGLFFVAFGFTWGVGGVAPTSLDSDYRLRRQLSADAAACLGDLVSGV